MPTIAIAPGRFGPGEIYFEEHGSGTAIVLIHGFLTHSRSWEQQVRALLPAEYRVITYDRRGPGDAGQPPAGYDYDAFAEDLLTLVTVLELREVALVAFSPGGGELGGAVAGATAASPSASSSPVAWRPTAGDYAAFLFQHREDAAWRTAWGPATLSA